MERLVPGKRGTLQQQRQVIGDHNYDHTLDKACLVSFKARCWRGVHVHRDETNAENQRHHTDRVGVSVKASNVPALASLVKLHAAARQEHYRLTLPCSDYGTVSGSCPSAGNWIIPNFLNESPSATSPLCRFMADYDQERNNARKALNGLYRDEFFPPAQEVRGRFTFKFRYLAVPNDTTWASGSPSPPRLRPMT